MNWPWVRRSALVTEVQRRDEAIGKADKAHNERVEVSYALTEARDAARDLSLKLADAEAEIARLRAVPDPMEGLTAEDIRDLLDTFAKGGACSTCGGIHVRSCPRVKSVEYDRQGDKVSIRRVDFWRKWDDSGVIFSDMLPDPDEVNGDAGEPS